MPSCIQIVSYGAPDADVPESTFIEGGDCSYLLLTQSEYEQLANQSNPPTTGSTTDDLIAMMDDYFSLLDPSFFTEVELQNFFIFFFSLPLITYLVAWGYQTVINFATSDEIH